MEFLKRIIRNALQAKATVISIVEGSGVQFRQTNNAVTAGGDNPVPRTLLDECFKFLLKRSSEIEALENGEYVESQFNITQLGDVLVIASKNQHSNVPKWELHLYLPPNGSLHYTTDLQKFRNKASANVAAGSANAASKPSQSGSPLPTNLFSLQTMGHSVTAAHMTPSEIPDALYNQQSAAATPATPPPPPATLQGAETPPSNESAARKGKVGDKDNVSWLPKFSNEPEIESFAMKEQKVAPSGQLLHSPPASPNSPETGSDDVSQNDELNQIPSIPIPTFDEQDLAGTIQSPSAAVPDQERGSPSAANAPGTFRIPIPSDDVPEMPMSDSLFAPPPPIAGSSANAFNADLAAKSATGMGTFQNPSNQPNTIRPDIDFSADAGAKGALSQGQNPIDGILKIMVQKNASDLHLTTNEPICMRIDGEIHRINQEPVSQAQMAQFVLPILPERNLNEFSEINDTDFAYEVEGLSRFRVNVFRDKNGVGMVLRNIPSQILTAEQLNLPSTITKFCNLSKGLVVVTGPTGSGKSTTLAAMIDLINKTRSDHILTIEDPVEFVHQQQKCLINQREVHKHTQSFARALKAALREDPDIVLIGEMRDLETVAIAIETAETGHLVFGTLHTTTAVSTVDRIIDQFPADQQEQIRMMLSSSLKGVVAQTLLKKKEGGRVAAHEILVVNDAVSAMIREGKSHMIPNHMQTQKIEGNILLNESLTRLVRENAVEPEEAIKKAVDKTSLIDSFRRLSIKLPPAYSGAAQSAAPQPGANLGAPHKQTA